MYNMYMRTVCEAIMKCNGEPKALIQNLKKLSRNDQLEMTIYFTR